MNVSPQFTDGGAHADWEFQTNDAADTYKGWVAGQLRPDFQIQEGAGSSTRFNKYDRGDVEMLTVATAPKGGMLRVSVNLEIYPD